MTCQAIRWASIATKLWSIIPEDASGDTGTFAFRLVATNIHVHLMTYLSYSFSQVHRDYIDAAVFLLNGQLWSCIQTARFFDPS